MKQGVSWVLAILLLAGSFLPPMETHELYKLHALVRHFEKHRGENPDMSFMEFLDLHYSSTPHHHQDHQTHQELPFSCNHHHSNIPAPVMAFVVPHITAPKVLIPLHDIGIAEYEVTVPHGVQSSIWQPPKQA